MDNVLTLAVGAVIGASFSASMKSVKDSITALSDKIKKVSDTRIDIKQYLKLKAEGKEGTKSFKTLEETLKKNKVNLANLEGEAKRLRLEFARLNAAAKIDVKIDDAKKRLNELNAITKKSLAVIGGAIVVHADVKQAQGELATLGVSADGLKLVSDEARAFTNQYAGITAPEFIRASADIKTGITGLTDASVAEFTKLAALTASATRSTTGEMTKLFSQSYGLFRKEFATDTEFAGKFASAFAATVKSYNISAQDLGAAMDNIGADAKHMGVTLSEQLATLGVAKSAMGNTSDAVKAYKGLLSTVTGAQDRLGLQMTDSYGRMLPLSDGTVYLKVMANFSTPRPRAFCGGEGQG